MSAIPFVCCFFSLALSFCVNRAQNEDSRNFPFIASHDSIGVESGTNSEYRITIGIANYIPHSIMKAHLVLTFFLFFFFKCLFSLLSDNIDFPHYESTIGCACKLIPIQLWFRCDLIQFQMTSIYSPILSDHLFCISLFLRNFFSYLKQQWINGIVPIYDWTKANNQRNTLG